MREPRRLKGLTKILVISGVTLTSLNILSMMAADAFLERGIKPEVIEKEYHDTFRHDLGLIGDIYLTVTKPGRELSYYFYHHSYGKKRIR